MRFFLYQSTVSSHPISVCCQPQLFTDGVEGAGHLGQVGRSSSLAASCPCVAHLDDRNVPVGLGLHHLLLTDLVLTVAAKPDITHEIDSGTCYTVTMVLLGANNDRQDVLTAVSVGQHPLDHGRKFLPRGSVLE